MVGLWILIVMLCLLIAIGSALLALRLQNRVLDQTRQEREAWRQAQEGRQRTWEVRQGKHILEAEKKLADQLKDARREWREWSAQLEQNQLDWQERADIEKEVARLPHVEHLELPLNAASSHQRPANWRPPMLYRADLSKRDLSYRYMERADLREADLTEANLYMADLTGASLAGANLERANLTGANLSGADLRGANLANASLLVADLHNAVLHGAVLLGARHLSAQQLQDAIYDSTTVIDSAIDVTLPRIPGVQVTPADLLGISQTKQTNVEQVEQTPAEDSIEPASGEKDAGEEATSAEIASASQDTAGAPNTTTSTPQTADTSGEEEQSEMPAEQEVPQPAASDEAEITPQVDAEEKSPEKAPPDESKIIQLAARTGKAPQRQGTPKRSSSTKRSGAKSKNASHREKSS